MARGMQSTAVEDRETTSLIANDKVEGTAVYDADGKHIGKIERLMIDELTGKVAYAVMSFGGILGIGADHYSIPWSLLRYNKKLGGYQVDITEQQLKNAPKFGQNENWDWSGRAHDQDVYAYWRVTLLGRGMRQRPPQTASIRYLRQAACSRP